MQKPSWVKINKNEFDLLILNVYNDLNNNEFKTTIDKKNLLFEKWKNAFGENNYSKN